MKNNFTFFWLADSEFSQWHPSIFKANNLIFISAEQYMMYQKALLFRDKNIAKEILLLNDRYQLLNDFLKGKITKSQILEDANVKKQWSEIQKEIKSFGRKVKGYNDKVWDRNRERIVFDGNMLKFNSSEDLKQKLINTKDTIIAEASPFDKIWGIGLKETDERSLVVESWQGLNLLGKALMSVRKKLNK